MAYQDLREWLAKLESEGELFRVKAKVDWDLEIGGIVQKIFDENGPALLFENIKDHENTVCRKLFSASLSATSRVALMMGLPKDTPYKEIIAVHKERIKKPVEPVIVKSGRVKENIVKEEDVDLWQFPAPKWHHLDGGRFLGTFDGVVTKDPDTGWTNIGLYRRQVHDEKTLGIPAGHGQHIWMHFIKYRKMGKPMPIAIVNGWDPVLPATACAPLPPGVCEYDIMGALRQKPVELVKCETNDLLVPADAEIVFEGEVPTDLSTMRFEGPFGEYTGYYGSEAGLKPIINVRCITHRSDPILQGTLEGVPINEDHRIESVNASSVIWNHLDQYMKGVTAVNVDPSTAWANIIVQVDNRYIGQPHQVASLIWGFIAPYWGKNIMVVDTDIDIFDGNKISWAFAYRVDPKKDLITFPGWGSPTDPIVHPAERHTHTWTKVNRLLIDATKPIHENPPAEEWNNERFAPVAYPDEETMKKVNDRWDKLGLAAFLKGYGR